MMRLRFALACLLLLTACAATRPAATESIRQRSSLGAGLVSDSARTLKELRDATPQHILDYALEDACAVIVLPGVYQAGFLYSLHAGSGVLVARTKGGGWGAPVFVNVGGAGFGIQAGLEKQRLVLVIWEQAMLERILSNGLHFDALAKFDVLGVREETGPGSLTEGRPLAAFTDGVGLMAGVALRGALLMVNESLTNAYYSQEQGDARAVLQDVNAPGIEVFELWAALNVNLPREQIQRASKPKTA
jgi:lipid-binding SYLF domain-containing protein